MEKGGIIKTNIVTSVVTVVFIGFLYLFYTSFFGSEKNIVNHKSISRGAGWENNKSSYSGSELGFTISKSDTISFELATDSEATQGVEIIINDEKYILNSPLLNKQKLSIVLDKNKDNAVTLKHFCTYYYHPCTIELIGIWVSKDYKLSPYQAHTKRISVLGDSISTNYGNKNYSYLLANALGFELHNASKLGSTLTPQEKTDSAINRYEKDLKNYPSDIVVIFIGSNDLAVNVSVEKFKTDYLKMVRDIKSWHPKAMIFTVGTLPRKDIKPDIIDEYNGLIKQVASELGVAFIDTSSWLVEGDFSDEIHPSIDSQEKMSQLFQTEIKSYIK